MVHIVAETAAGDAREAARPERVPMASRIISAICDAPELTPTEYFERHNLNRPALRPLGRACHDCAVVCGLYSEFSDILATLDAPLVRASALRWFCHNNPGRACRGNIDRLRNAGCDLLTDGALGAPR